MERKLESIKGLHICITGKLRRDRMHYVALIEEVGAIFDRNVTVGTNYLVIGEKTGGKLKKAQQLEIPLLSESEFMDLYHFTKDKVT